MATKNINKDTVKALSTKNYYSWLKEGEGATDFIVSDSLSGTHYNETSTFSSKASTDEYIDIGTFIKDLQNELYTVLSHFADLCEGIGMPLE